MNEKWNIECIRRDSEHECVHVGQLAKIWRWEGRQCYVELACGHPYTISQLSDWQYIHGGGLLEPTLKSDIESLKHNCKSQVKVEHQKERIEMAPKKINPDLSAKLVGEPVLNQGIIPDSKGAIPVAGLELKVKQFKTDSEFLKTLTERVTLQKEEFRQLASEAAGRVLGHVHCVNFVGDGCKVPVTFPDVSLAASRTLIKPEVKNEAINLGFNMDEMKLTEKSSSFVLKGEWVDWFRSVLSSYVAKGEEPPEGAEEKTEERLTLKAVHELREMRKQPGNAATFANLVLESGIKSAMVTVK